MKLMRSLLMLLLSVVVMRAADEAQPGMPRTLAECFVQHGVTEANNTYGTAEERTASGLTGRSFISGDRELREAIWKAMRKSRFLTTQQEEPKGEYVFAVLHTGDVWIHEPVYEFFISKEGKAYCRLDDKPVHRTLLVFEAPELKELMYASLEKYGKPPLKLSFVTFFVPRI